MPLGRAVCQEPMRLRPAGRWPWPEPAMLRSDHRMTDGMCAPITGLRPYTRPMAGARTALRATRPAPPAGQGMCAPITGRRPCTRPMPGARTALRATRPAPPAGQGMCAPITGLRPYTRPMAGARTALRATRPAPPAGQGNRLKPVVGPGRDLPGSRAGAVPNRSRISRTPLPGPFPARDDPRHWGRGRGRGGWCDGGGGRGCKCERNVNVRRQPLDSKRPASCPTVGSAVFPPRSPGPGRPARRIAAASGNGFFSTFVTSVTR
jgi:hypothetical protein